MIRYGEQEARINPTDHNEGKESNFDIGDWIQ